MYLTVHTFSLLSGCKLDFIFICFCSKVCHGMGYDVLPVLDCKQSHFSCPPPAGKTRLWEGLLVFLIAAEAFLWELWGRAEIHQIRSFSGKTMLYDIGIYGKLTKGICLNALASTSSPLLSLYVDRLALMKCILFFFSFLQRRRRCKHSWHGSSPFSPPPPLWMGHWRLFASVIHWARKSPGKTLEIP